MAGSSAIVQRTHVVGVGVLGSDRRIDEGIVQRLYILDRGR